MAGATNSFEGGSNGVAISTGNSGGLSGTAFDKISLDPFADPPMDPLYSTARAAHGTVSGLLNGGKGNGVGWDLSGSNSTRWVRAYLYKAGAWTGDVEIFIDMANGCYFALRPGASNVLLRHYNNSSEATIATIAVTPASGQWIRLELQANNGAGGAAEARLYNSADSLTPSGQASGSRAQTASAWSSTNVFSSASADVWVDSVGWSDVDWLGSAAPVVPRPRSFIVGSSVAVHRTANW
ncbi:hypothetical protein [Streptosporangium sp. NPDC049078]|uniref:hypothetical protein n=1 Tax=Streptosporangium sp. NPDC049078 TaxID=3155767 RepID=UPI00341A632C